MKFIDQINLKVKAGKGGDGMIAFRREAHVDRGGPSGGDGGHGGDIYFQGDSGVNTLLHLHYKKNIQGEDGTNGGRKNLYGAAGKDTFVKVPLGTVVLDKQFLIADIVAEKAYLIAKGGKGGRGNARFKTQKNRAPRINELGLQGEEKNLQLTLKVIADIGLVGFPNAGKSTLINALSNAKAKVADYPFTTLVPQLGLVRHFEDSFVIADLPGLINNASQGKGLGVRFLQHIERCKVIAYVLDFSSEEKSPIQAYQELQSELRHFDSHILEKWSLIIANKNDYQARFKKNYELFQATYPELKIIPISALLRENLSELKSALYQLSQQKPAQIVDKEEASEVTITYDPDYEVEATFPNEFEIKGIKVAYWYQRIPLTTLDNLLRFNKILKRLGVWNELVKKGVQKGDTIRIFSYEFTWGSVDI